MFKMILLLFVLSISIILYIVSLGIFIVYNHLNISMLIITLYSPIIVSFFFIKELIMLNEDKAIFRNLDNRFSVVHGYCSFVLLFLFGISLIFNSLIHRFSILNLVVGFMIFVLFIYITLKYILSVKNKVLMLVSVDDTEEGVNCLYFENGDDEYEFYVNKKKKYTSNVNYLCCLDGSSKYIKRIIKEVVRID